MNTLRLARALNKHKILTAYIDKENISIGEYNMNFSSPGVCKTRHKQFSYSSLSILLKKLDFNYHLTADAEKIKAIVKSYRLGKTNC